MQSKKTGVAITAAVDAGKDYEPGVLMNFTNGQRGGFGIEPVLVFNNAAGRRVWRIPFTDKRYLRLPHEVVRLLQCVTDEALITYLVKKGYHFLGQASDPFSKLDHRHYALLHDLYYEVAEGLKLFMPVLKRFFHLPAAEVFDESAVKAASISSFTPALHFRLVKEPQQVRLVQEVIMNEVVYPLTDFEQQLFFLRSRNEYFLLKKEDAATLQWLQQETLVAPVQQQATFMQRVVKPLMEKYAVETGELIPAETIQVLPRGQVFVSELNENFLLIKPKWLYGEWEVDEWEGAETTIESENMLYRIVRDKAAEQLLIDTIRALNPKFNEQHKGFFYLSFKEALHKNWFLTFYNSLLQLEVPVYGMDKLKKFKYNTHQPVFVLDGHAGIDWFDITITVHFGNQVVPLHELRKAIINNQPYVMLADGSLGMLPEAWRQKLSLLMKIGHLKESVLQVARTHWTVLDLPGYNWQNEALQKELQERRERLLQVESGIHYPMPASIQAQLRDYQQGGFQWMCMLDDMRWGGCLADDMGLGKTLQTITFLQYVIDKYPNETNLVVCPTSLIYNWESELKKFAPALKYHIHYGADRIFDRTVFNEAHLIITSYGMVRSDLEHFEQFRFGYLVLDESQVIKNITSRTAKAVQALKARNRIALSGTPIQNNTFDLYAQMNFLNPGMLGSQEFFKREFANPIDKQGDKEKSAALRKLIYPFLLRRTKEQVAKDLPDKTEMIMWCEMEKEQRTIYDSFKDHYRKSIIHHIDGEGLQKSSIYILEGLTKLRQICNSPALLKDEGVYTGSSTKLTELIREVKENAGQHKVLVFSQFTSMLQLIGTALQQKNIAYLYLDGSTSAEQRKQSVTQFQAADDQHRVFLISLKAGGVGLTLTAADYVYLVDPWWNPAAEQQAIDRTHRIGQQKKVFAYRLICKDTVEEKIMQLQERKKSLAADLISDEGGFIKKLTREDVVYLFD